MDVTLEPSVVLQAAEDTYIWTINKTRLPVPGHQRDQGILTTFLCHSCRPPSPSWNEEVELLRGRSPDFPAATRRLPFLTLAP